MHMCIQIRIFFIYTLADSTGRCLPSDTTTILCIHGLRGRGAARLPPRLLVRESISSGRILLMGQVHVL